MQQPLFKKILQDFHSPYLDMHSPVNLVKMSTADLNIIIYIDIHIKTVVLSSTQLGFDFNQLSYFLFLNTMLRSL